MISSAKADAFASFKKGNYEAAILLYEACLMDAKTTHGDFSLEVFSFMDKLAICYSETKKFDKAIRANEERFEKMSPINESQGADRADRPKKAESHRTA
jgi:tetratricopeptide (TPR) repeat protein